MRVAVRVDANRILGTGHVMRCLCLADELLRRGGQVEFLSRNLPGYLKDVLQSRRHYVTDLPELNSDLMRAMPSLFAETPWPDAVQKADAAQTVSELNEDVDWLVVDHYGLGALWEAQVRLKALHILSIDDLGREHVCDLLLDQNYYYEMKQRYRNKVPSTCRAMLGPRYALLRPEFAQLREQAKVRSGPAKRALVFLGGMDQANYTALALQAWQELGRIGIGLDVVIGNAHPAKDWVLNWCKRWPGAQCHIQTSRMAELMAQSDIAVGAGGGATWERCALGLPTLALCIADNQYAVLSACAEAGVVYQADQAAPMTSGALSSYLAALLDSGGLRTHMSALCLSMVDGLGVRRVANALAAGTVSVRQASIQDCDLMLGWRNDPLVRSVSRDNREIPLEQHRQWFGRVLVDPDKCLLIGEQDGVVVGVVRFDIVGDSAEVSIYLVASAVGAGLGARLLDAAEAWFLVRYPTVHRWEAEVQHANIASKLLFEHAGYSLHSSRFSKDIG